MRRSGSSRTSVALALALMMLTGGVPGLTMAAPQTPQTPPAPAAAPPSTAPGTIRGSMVDKNGQPLIGYRVKVTDANGTIFQSDPTGPDGKYEIKGLAPSTYSYSIFDPQGNEVAVKIPPVKLEPGTMVTVPIAIVPRAESKKKGPLIAWLVGGGAAAAALIIAGNNNDNNNEPSMTPH